MNLETRRSPRKTSRHTTSLASVLEDRSPADPQTVHAVYPVTNHNSKLNNTTSSFLRSIPYNDHILRDRRQDFPHRCSNGYEAPSLSRLLCRLRGTDHHDCTFSGSWSRGADPHLKAIHELRCSSPIPDIRGEDAERRLRHLARPRSQ